MIFSRKHIITLCSFIALAFTLLSSGAADAQDRQANTSGDRACILKYPGNCSFKPKFCLKIFPGNCSSRPDPCYPHACGLVVIPQQKAQYLCAKKAKPGTVAFKRCVALLTGKLPTSLSDIIKKSKVKY